MSLDKWVGQYGVPVKTKTSADPVQRITDQLEDMLENIEDEELILKNYPRWVTKNKEGKYNVRVPVGPGFLRIGQKNGIPVSSFNVENYDMVEQFFKDIHEEIETSEEFRTKIKKYADQVKRKKSKKQTA